jgi:glycine/D-amino acid oxidase-like deaminating enzyme
MDNQKFLIVGQGIAGTCIAWQLIKEGKQFKIVDKGSDDSSSFVAAGLYNPIVFKRYTHSWMAEELINYLDKFYAELEDLLQVKFHSKNDIIKVFTNDEEKDFWKKKSPQDQFMSDEIDEEYYLSKLKPNKGVAHVIGGGAVDLKLMLKSFREYLIKNGLIIENAFDYDQLRIEKEAVFYLGESYHSVIFCEGWFATRNPYFPQSAFKLTHGETVEILAEGLPQQDVINKGAFLLPKGNEVYKVGATYRWQAVDGKTSEEGLEELKSKIENILSCSYSIKSHEAGVRPTVVDRRPLLGASKQHSNLFFFNGMGTKGVMLAPYFSKQLVEHIIHQASLHHDVHIARYY